MPNPVDQSSVHPQIILHHLASQKKLEVDSLEFAHYLDKHDPLADFRKRFNYPKKHTFPGIDQSVITHEDEEVVYLCGNSLGLMPKKSQQNVTDQFNKWSSMGVAMHFLEPYPAATCDAYGKDILGKILGADPESLSLMNSLTVNLHLLLISFYQPTKERFKILIEEHAFPSDRYAMHSQIKMRGYNPDEGLIEVGPSEGEVNIDPENIIDIIRERGHEIAVICLSGIQYYTGQKFDMEEITRVGHEHGCLVGWDLAHAVGNVRLDLEKWNVDFACWCNYKYLNGGAGTIGGAYVNQKHNSRKNLHLLGWWGNKASTRFLMKDTCDVAEGVDSFKLSNPSPFMVSMVMASLEIFEEATMDKLLLKQRKLTGFLELLLDNAFEIGSQQSEIKLLTPRDLNQRGSQLSLQFSKPSKYMEEELAKNGIVCDVRKPDVLRVAPVPIYNSFKDVFHFVTALKNIYRKS